MYKLDNNVEWTEELKNAFKTGTTRAKIIYDGNQEINETNMLKSLELKDTQYVPSLGFIGQACSKELTFSFVNSEGINLENKELTLKIGAEYNGDVYYITYGNFIVCEAPHNDKTNNVTSVVANDYMIKFDVPYEDTITYPCTLKELAQNICEAVGVELGSEEFSNSDFVVVDNQFEGSTAKEVIKNIAKSAFSWTRIGQDNKLYFDLENGEEKEEEGTSFTLENPNYLQDGSIIKLTNESESTVVEGTTFELTDADVDKKHSIIELEGNTTQNGTPTPTNPIPIYTVSGDNEVTVNGSNFLDIEKIKTQTWTNNVYRGTRLNDINSRGTWCFKAQLKEGKTAISGLYVAIAQTINPNASTNALSIKNGVTQASTKTFTGTDLYISFYPTSHTIEEITEVYDLWISKSDTTYEPYTGNSYRVDFGGKNLIKLTDGTYSSNGVTVVVENGKITLNRTATSSGTSFINIPLAEDIVISPNEYYTFSANNNFVLGNTTQSGNYACIRFRTSTTDDSTNDVLFGTLNNSKTFQKDTTWTYKYLRVRTASSLSYNDNVIYPQLEKRKYSNKIQSLCK